MINTTPSFGVFSATVGLRLSFTPSREIVGHWFNDLGNEMHRLVRRPALSSKNCELIDEHKRHSLDVSICLIIVQPYLALFWLILPASSVSTSQALGDTFHCTQYHCHHDHPLEEDSRIYAHGRMLTGLAASYSVP